MFLVLVTLARKFFGSMFIFIVNCLPSKFIHVSQCVLQGPPHSLFDKVFFPPGDGIYSHSEVIGYVETGAHGIKL